MAEDATGARHDPRGKMSKHFDELETRSADQRVADLAQVLPTQIGRAKALPGYAAALAEVVVEADRLGADIGALDILQRYESWRRFDTFQMGVTTDVLNRLFSNDNPALELARGLGLGAVNALPGLRRFFIREAAGLNAAQPRLLQGLPV